MKLVFGIDLTDKHNNIMDGEPFFTRHLSEPLDHVYQNLSAVVEGFDKKCRLPAVLRAVKWVAGMSAFAIPCVLIESCETNSKHSNADTKANLLILAIGAIMFLIWLILTLVESNRAAKLAESNAYHEVKTDSETFSRLAKDDLGVPENAADMDFLAARYHWINGKMYSTYSHIIWYYENMSLYAWAENDCLCLADSTMRLDIPFETFRGAERQKNGYYITSWNKPVSYKSPEYKPYRICITDGNLCANGYLAIRLTYKGEDYELRVPPWEEETLRQITGWPFPPKRKQM